MSAQSMNKNPQLLSLSLADGTTDITALFLALMPRKMKLVKASFIDAAGFTGDTDYVVIEIKIGSTVLASWDSRSSGQGTIAAGVAVDLVLASDAADLIAAKGSKVVLALNKGGAAATSGAALSLLLEHVQTADVPA